MDNTERSHVDSIPKWLILIVTIGFAILTIFSLVEFGFIGIILQGVQNSATLQIYVDLIITLLLFLVWLKHDTKRKGRNFYLWLVITLIFGGFGPLFYLLTRK